MPLLNLPLPPSRFGYAGYSYPRDVLNTMKGNQPTGVDGMGTSLGVGWEAHILREAWLGALLTFDYSRATDSQCPAPTLYSQSAECKFTVMATSLQIPAATN
jgi:hypothetical protein